MVPARRDGHPQRRGASCRHVFRNQAPAGERLAARPDGLTPVDRHSVGPDRCSVTLHTRTHLERPVRSHSRRGPNSPDPQPTFRMKGDDRPGSRLASYQQRTADRVKRARCPADQQQARHDEQAQGEQETGAGRPDERASVPRVHSLLPWRSRGHGFDPPRAITRSKSTSGRYSPCRPETTDRVAIAHDRLVIAQPHPRARARVRGTIEPGRLPRRVTAQRKLRTKVRTHASRISLSQCTKMTCEIFSARERENASRNPFYFIENPCRDPAQPVIFAGFPYGNPEFRRVPCREEPGPRCDNGRSFRLDPGRGRGPARMARVTQVQVG